MSRTPPPGRVKGPAKTDIDWRSVPFASNGITLGQLRQSFGSDHEQLGVFVHNLVLLEFEVAWQALREALHRPLGRDAMAVNRFARKESAKDLRKLYSESGIATGNHQAAELVRNLETWATLEARKYTSHKSR